MIPQSLLQQTTQKINKLSSATQKALLKELNAIKWKDIAELREKTIETLNKYSLASAETASAIGADFYEQGRAIQINETYNASTYTPEFKQANNNAIRGMIEKVVKGEEVEVFFNEVCNRVDYNIKKSVGETVYKNGAKDKQKVKFARVPTGKETCTFCIMLASRGAVYLAKENAGDSGHYHPNCDCRIVPVFNDVLDIEGYDPNVLYKQWKELENKQRKKVNDENVTE